MQEEITETREGTKDDKGDSNGNGKYNQDKRVLRYVYYTERGTNPILLVLMQRLGS